MQVPSVDTRKASSKGETAPAGVTRVCMIIENHWRVRAGGAPFQGKVIAEALSSRPEFEVFYLARGCPARLDLDPYTIVKIGNASGIRRRAVFFDAPGLWRALKTIRPDVIYQRTRQSYTAIAAMYARRYGSKFVFHIASDYDVTPGRMRRHISLNTPFDLIEGALGRYGLTHAGTVVAQTRRQADLLWENFGLRAAAVIPNMHPEPDPADLGDKPSDVIQVAWLANFKVVKRPELFVRLAEDFKHDASVRFVMAGAAGHSRTYRTLHEQIRRLPNLEYLGPLTLEEADQLVGRSHILVNTSEVEGFSNTFIQAWLRNTVLFSISADIDGALASRGLGYLVGDYGGLRDQLTRLLTNKPELARTAERAREFARAHYTTGNIGELVELLRVRREAARS
jgi:glycosyltransferase involved in cell wall biosynthesis